MPRFYDLNQWLEDSKDDLKPPVCAKNLYNDQIMVLFVGGPNVRKDYHIDCGEELFYQVKGDMVLKIVEQGCHRDIHIKQGEIFLLPARIPHSPQRFTGTLGLISERVRDVTEKDGIRYYIEKEGETTTTELWEAWFHCEDILKQLPSVLQAFLDSEQGKTGRPAPGGVSSTKPISVDTETAVESPFNLTDWINTHREEIDREGFKHVFDEHYQMKVLVCGEGKMSDYNEHADMVIWQQIGSCVVSQQGLLSVTLKKNNTLRVPSGTRYTVQQDCGALSLLFGHNPTKAKTWPKH